MINGMIIAVDMAPIKNENKMNDQYDIMSIGIYSTIYYINNNAKPTILLYRENKILFF